MYENETEKWDELLERISMGRIIPVLGKQLYSVVENNHETEISLLYDYLVKQLIKQMPDYQGEHNFPKVCFEYLNRGNRFVKLKKIFEDSIVRIDLHSDSPLDKLLSIRNFDFFINTTYDDLFAERMKILRDKNTESIDYAILNRSLEIPNDKDRKHPIVYNLFGNFTRNIDAALKESDIMESVLEFHRDMGITPLKSLKKKLQGNSLLFIGCGYEDWLFRFLLRVLRTTRLDFKVDGYPVFLSDNLLQTTDGLETNFYQFLTENNIIAFHEYSSIKFVEKLYEKILEMPSTMLIEYRNRKPVVFISFQGSDRITARRLSKKLQREGVEVWLDEEKLRGGDKVDNKIVEAINNIPVFMPLNSKNTVETHHDGGEPKYHYQEWEWAERRAKRDNNFTIIPVVLDDIDNLFENFKGIFAYEIPDGRDGDFDKLKRDLQKKQRKYHGQ